MKVMITVFFLWLGTLCQAQTFSSQLSYLQRYLSGDTGMVVTTTPLTTINLNFAKGSAYFNLWHASDLAGRSGYNNETDYSFGYSVSPGLTVEGSYYDLWGPADLFSLRAMMQQGRVYAMVLDLIPTDPKVLGGGWCYRSGYTIPCSRSVSVELSLAGNTGLFGHQPELLSSGRVSVTWSGGKKLPFSVYLAGQRRLGAGHLAPKESWNIGLSWAIK